jgi:hypothetical protein
MIEGTANLNSAISILYAGLQNMTRAFPINDQKITLLPNHFAVMRYFNAQIILVEDIKNFVLPGVPCSALIAMAVLLIPPDFAVNLLLNEFSYALRVLHDLRESTSAFGHDLISYLDLLAGHDALWLRDATFYVVASAKLLVNRHQGRTDPSSTPLQPCASP